ncbi:hypothetical protein [Rhodophyticola sp.]|jgi:hypothetical protein|uniref:hypothetical protein n=1 Tax=Rhodophyticola sp. TaxID=2680032 RepID=UPI003D2AADE4
MRFGDVPDQGFVDAAGRISKDQLGLNAALPELEWRRDHLQLLVDLVSASFGY